MESINREELIWSYLDNDISVKDKLYADELRANDPNFVVQFKELEAMHKGLYELPLIEVDSDFSSKLVSVVTNEFSAKNNGLNINPLFIFAILLGSLGTAFYIFGNDAAGSISILTGNHLELIEVPLITESINTITNINLQMNWYYFAVLLVVPCLFIWEKLMEHNFSSKQYMFV